MPSGIYLFLLILSVWNPTCTENFINLRRFSEMMLFLVLMSKRIVQFGSKLHFSRWNRKGYAIFASLGREVRIGTLAIHICEMSLQKSSRKGVIVNLSEVFERLVRLFEGYEEKVVQACRVSSPSRVDAGCINRYLNINV